LCFRTATISIRADARGANRFRPTLDLGRQIFGEIFGRAALGRDDFEALSEKPWDKSPMRRGRSLGVGENGIAELL
jgi:hypothetical protein